MPSLDVVVSVYRETGAPALYAALATIHARAPLRLAVFLHDGNANPTIAWSPPANVTGGGALAHNRAHHTHDRIFIADSAGKLRNCAGTTCERPACAARQCPLAPAGGAAAYAALEARGARFWHDLASLSLDPVASAGVPWEYLWRGVLAGSDAELGDDCAGNRTVRERS